MDEPFSALDVLTAENLRGELLELWDNEDFPIEAIVLVTHNIEEAVILADRIIVLGSNPGRIPRSFRSCCLGHTTATLPSSSVSSRRSTRS